MRYPETLNKLIAIFKRLPGIGSKSAERIAFELILWPKEKIDDLVSLLSQLKGNVSLCPICGALSGPGGCLYCDVTKRDPNVLCAVASLRDLYLMEETREFRGLYHIISFYHAPMQGRAINLQSVERLKERITTHSVKEVVLAFDATLDGDATALFLKKELSSLPIRLTRLAFGIPLGSSFDFVDGATLARALQGRQTLSK